MNKFYKWYIVAKQNYYKIYWRLKKKFRKPESKGFYGWVEYNYDVLDQEAVGYGVLIKN